MFWLPHEYDGDKGELDSRHVHTEHVLQGKFASIARLVPQGYTHQANGDEGLDMRGNTTKTDGPPDWHGRGYRIQGPDV
jgi:hypothetical protein